MVAYTDGIVESPNVTGEHWRGERLVHTVVAGEERSAGEFN